MIAPHHLQISKATAKQDADFADASRAPLTDGSKDLSRQFPENFTFP